MYRKILILFIILISSWTGSASDFIYEDYNNILSQEIQERDIFANNTVTYQFNTISPINSIDVIGKTNEWDISLKVEILKNVSKLVGEIPVNGDVYRYFNIWTRHEKIEMVTINYTINDPNYGDSRLYYWNDSEWRALDTNTIGNIKNPSHFAIVGINESETIILSGDIKEKEITKDEEETVTNEENTYDEEIIDVEDIYDGDMYDENENVKQSPTFGLIFVILIFILLYYIKKN